MARGESGRSSKVEGLHKQTVDGPIDGNWSGNFQRTVHFLNFETFTLTPTRKIEWSLEIGRPAIIAICGKWTVFGAKDALKINAILFIFRDGTSCAKLREVAVFRCFELEKPKLSRNFQPETSFIVSKNFENFFLKI